MNADTDEKQATGTKKQSLLKRILLIVVALIVAALVGTCVYMSIPMPADDTAKRAMESTGAFSSGEVTVEKTNGKIAFVPKEPMAGLIFYPGARVDPEAYAPLMQCLASRGVLCVVCPMPFNFALVGVNAADGIQSTYPQVKTWYIGGHSLGGVAASLYVKNHSDSFAGLVLLASRSTENLSNEPLKVLEIHGSNDGVIKAEAMEDARSNVSQLEEVVIPGGNHAQMGSYGKQDGDGAATISAEEQWNATADIIVAWMK